jgi:hypothetical protein
MSTKLKRTAKKPQAVTKVAQPADPAPLLADPRDLILAARQNVARAIDSGLVTLSWRSASVSAQDILQEKRAKYGEQIVATLSRQLVADFGRGFEEKNLHDMIPFVEAFPDEHIVAALRRQLSWTHFKAIMPIADPLKRDFYTEMTLAAQQRPTR